MPVNSDVQSSSTSSLIPLCAAAPALAADVPPLDAFVRAHADPAWGGTIVAIPTDVIRHHRDANRAPDSLTPEALADLRASIVAAGRNEVPAIVVPLALGAAEQAGARSVPMYALVAGHRRLQVCRELGLPLRCEVRHGLSDSEVRVVMARENLARSDVSLWEIGGMLERHIAGAETGMTTKQAASELGFEYTTATRALNLRKLDPAVLAAFASPTHLTQQDVKFLASVYGDLTTPAQKEVATAVNAAATELAEMPQRLPHRQAMQRLQRAAVGQTNSPSNRPAEGGKPMDEVVDFAAPGGPVLQLGRMLTPREKKDLESVVRRWLEATRQNARAARPSVSSRGERQ